MYPNLYYVLRDWFNVDSPFFKAINSLGLFVVLSFFAAAWALTKELKRKEGDGDFDYELKKLKIKILPSNTVPLATVAAAVAGIIGAKIFGISEYWNSFLQHPFEYFFSANGFIFYGGLTVASVTLWFYYKSKNINTIKMADAIAPGLMPAYAIGRIGCHVAGDGDWGIVNQYAKPFAWVPDWLWAYDYPHNISKAGVYIPGCDWGEYCYRLQPAVYPTPLYETIIVFILFAILWSLRKRFKMAGRLSAVYLLFISTERFFIEIIRINPRYNFFGLSLTQAQIISLTFFVGGVLLYLLAPKLKANNLVA
jgi:phosphatidylglycerol:prolipoprotein diacylglycerol transferase